MISSHFHTHYSTSMAEGSDADEVAAIFDAMFNGVSLQSLLLDHTPHHPIVSDYPPPSPSLQPPPLAFSDQCPLSYSFSAHEGSDSGFPISSRSISLKLPKQELLYVSDGPVAAAHQPPPLLLQSVGHSFQTAQPASDSHEATPNHFRRKHGAITAKPGPATRRAAASRNRNNQMARQRRRRINEKMRCLKKLMPWNRKMDTATLLEEAHKYILFLEAQVSALYSMPVVHADDPPPLLHHPTANQVMNCSDADSSIGYDRSAPSPNRQQTETLQMLVSSPVAQTVVYSQGQCMVSAEQLLDTAETTRIAAQQQQQSTMMFDSSSPVWNFY